MATYRRRTILINRPFQIRFSIYVVGWLAALSFVYPLIISNLFEYFVRYLAADPSALNVSSLYATRKEVLMLLSLSSVAFLALTFLMSLFISHRIAGPIFKLRKNFQDFANGTLRGKLKFREKDYFPELADDFNAMVVKIRERDVRENEILTTANLRIEAAMKMASADVKNELETALISIRKLQEQRASESNS